MATWRQNEWLNGALRRLAQGSGNPMALLKNWRSSVTTVMRETGAPRSRAAIRVSRSNASSGAVSRRTVRATAASRALAAVGDAIGATQLSEETRTLTATLLSP